MLKAAAEAKQFTNWTEPNEAYRAALTGFVTDTLADREFRADFEQFVAYLIDSGWLNSLAQTLIKLTAPGAPDFYQGAELWDLSLVDPDNRRPVDFETRRRLMAELDQLSPETIWKRRGAGVPKLWLIRQTLQLRQKKPEWFAATASYDPLFASGPKAGCALAFLRGGAVASITPRLPATLAGDWGDTTLQLPAGKWENELTGEVWSGNAVPLAQALARFPVALLVKAKS
jgi:(1->4)-alpha-D-glucan 1-alpha-D-glucosylmutase